MASSLGVSRPTIYNEMKRHGIDYQGKFSNHDNEELKAAMSNIKVNHPNAGEFMIQGHHHSKVIEGFIKGN